jgi:hypothetical protein
MFGDRRPAGAEVSGQLADGKSALPQQRENVAPSGIGDRPKHYF